MLERTKNFMKGVVQLIRNPNLLEEYKSALSTVNHYHNEAAEDKKRLQEAYGQVNEELNFRKEMEAQGIAAGQRYVDMELGPDLLLDRPWEAQDEAFKVNVSYVQLTGFSASIEDGDRFIETNLGRIRAERFLDRMGQGKLVMMEQAQLGEEQKKQLIREDIQMEGQTNHRAMEISSNSELESWTEEELIRWMEATDISVGREYVNLHMAEAPVLTVTGFHVENGTPYIETDQGNLWALTLGVNLYDGTLVPKELAARDQVPNYTELVDRMKMTGFAPVVISEFSQDSMWKDVKTGSEFYLDGWQQVKDFVSQVEQGKIAWMLFYEGHQAMWFQDSKQYIEEYKEDLNDRGPNGVSARTITKDPAVRKAMDDLIYGEFGEENPNGLEYYAQQQRVQEPEAMEQEVIGMEM